MSRRILIPALMGALAVTLALAGCHRPPKARTTAAEQARAVSVVRVEPRAITGALAASGDLQAREEAAVLPEVSGYRVTRVLADVGDYVRKGQVLAQLDPSLLEAQITEAQVNAEQARSQASRVAGLDNSGVLSEEQIQQRRFQAETAAAQLRDLRTRERKLSVTAPVTGLILEKTVRPGDLATAGGTPWFRLARDGEIELQAQLSEDDLAKVRVGQSVMVSLPDGSTVNGRVRLISPEIDANTKLGFVRITLPVRSDIRAGGFARAVFTGASAQLPAVPDSAVTYDADGASVMVVDATNHVHRVPVETGLRGGGWVQLLKGPAANTRVVRASGGLLLDGDLVRPVEVAPAASAATP